LKKIKKKKKKQIPKHNGQDSELFKELIKEVRKYKKGPEIITEVLRLIQIKKDKKKK